MGSIKKIVLLSIAIVIVTNFLVSCTSKTEDYIRINANETYLGNIKVNKEGGKKIEWQLDGKNKKSTNMSISIIINNIEVNNSKELKGEYNIADDDVEVIIKIKNEGDSAVEVKPNVNFVCLGSAGNTTVTVTKPIEFKLNN